MEPLGTLQALVPQLKSFGKRTAVITFAKEDSEEWTYAELSERAESLAAGLIDENIVRGITIAIWGEDSPQWIAACLGVLRCGAVAVPLDVQLDDKGLRHALKDIGAELLFTTERLLKRARPVAKERHCRLVLLGDKSQGVRGWEEIAAKPRQNLAAVSPDEPAILFYTSGTTGPPKGVPLTHRNLAFQLDALAGANLVTSDDRVLLPLPLHHVYPFTIGLLTPPSLGLPIVLPYMLTGPQLVRAIREARVTMIIGVPRLYSALLDGIQSRAAARGRVGSATFQSLLALSTALAAVRIRIGKSAFGRLQEEMGPQLRVLASGGAALDPGLARKLEGLGWLVGTGYGLTETSPLLTLDKPGESRIGSVGRPIEGVEIRIDSVGETPERKPAQIGRAH